MFMFFFIMYFLYLLIFYAYVKVVFVFDTHKGGICFLCSCSSSICF